MKWFYCIGVLLIAATLLRSPVVRPHVREAGIHTLKAASDALDAYAIQKHRQRLIQKHAANR
jgi:hypothetical protein